MSVVVSKRTDNIEIKLTAYHNCDDVQLYWLTKVNENISSPIEDCLGFILERQRMDKNGKWLSIEILNNRVGFENTPVPTNNVEKEIFRTPSNICPFQTYNWTDHGANSGQVVRYRVSAAKLPDNGIPGISILIPIADSGWTEAIKISAVNNNISAYFNRGFVMSQFVSRIARINKWRPVDIKNNVRKLKEPLRVFLSGELRLALLKMLDEVICDPSLELYAALYELSDDELIGKLRLLQDRAHIILANGAKGDDDENSNARRELNGANVDVHNRMLKNKGLGHNKFAIIYNTRTKKATKVWSGSTNWTPSGLCTQVNNGFLIEDEKVSEIYLDQWHRLFSARNNFTQELIDKNAGSPRTSENIDVWFTPIKSHSQRNNNGPKKDIKELMKLVKGAKEMLLYVMFQPGDEPLNSIMSLPSEIYVRGVVSTLTSSNEERFELSGINTESNEYRTRLIQPEGIGEDISSWIKEVLRSQFIPKIGWAITHSKMIVIDPLSDDCIVITGSHNFSKAASESNDENFIIVKGNKPLAEAYAVACLSTYAHYHWRAYAHDKISKGERIWAHLSDKPEWQERYLRSERINDSKIWNKEDILKPVN